MERLCIFAHYDKDNIVDDYVIYYLQELKKFFNTIIFVSDSNLPDSEKNKVSNLCNYIKAEHHGEYDWGSYKYGYIIAKEKGLLSSAAELLLCNDSVYGPVCSLEPFFNKMTNDSCDFWGMFENKDGINKGTKENHLQSWFLLLKKDVFNSEIFDNFILSVRKFQDKNELINQFEVGFTQKMSSQFEYKALYTSEKGNAVTQAAPILLKKGFPFIKTVVLKKYFITLCNLTKKQQNLYYKHSKRISSLPFINKLIKTVFWKLKMRKIKISFPLQ